MNKKLIIIGAGIGGLATGIYAQLNGFSTEIFESHSIPGGQCTSWKRKGYVFDACIHHLFGTNDKFLMYQLWKELGAAPNDWIYPKESVSVMSSVGQLFHDYYNLEELRNHMLALSPIDKKGINMYIEDTKLAGKFDFLGEAMMGSSLNILKNLPHLFKMRKQFTKNLRKYAENFKNPFLRQAFPQIMYSLPQIPAFLHLAKKAYGAEKAIAWPKGGSLPFILRIAKRYEELGGKLHLQQNVDKILTKNDSAFGIKLTNGEIHQADIVVSNADGRKTLYHMLDGKYLTDRVRGMCKPHENKINWKIHVFLGLNRNLENFPSALLYFLDKPVTIADHTYDSMDMQIYGFDPSMAPKGKGVIKVELLSTYSYWKNLREKAKYKDEKKRVAEKVIEVLEKPFPGITSQVEVVDVPTLLTWERFMQGSRGFMVHPFIKESIMSSIFSKKMNNELPKLKNFYFVGSWVSRAGFLVANAKSGKKLVKFICHKEKLPFSSTPSS